MWAETDENNAATDTVEDDELLLIVAPNREWSIAFRCRVLILSFDVCGVVFMSLVQSFCLISRLVRLRGNLDPF